MAVGKIETGAAVPDNRHGCYIEELARTGTKSSDEIRRLCEDRQTVLPAAKYDMFFQRSR